MQALLVFISNKLSAETLNFFLWSIIATSWALFGLIVISIVRKIFK